MRAGAINRKIHLEGYKLIHGDSKTSAGGVALYIKDTLTFSINECSQRKLHSAELLWVDIQTKRSFLVVVGVIYRNPDDSGSGIDKFDEEINDLFLTINKNKGTLYCVGDFIINLLKLSYKAVICRYASTLMSCNCRCLIDKPVRIRSSSSTLIEYIYSNDKIEPVTAGLFTYANLSDHYGIFIVIPQRLLKKRQILENFEI